MILYRFSLEQYSKDLSGDGAKKYGGRWNSKGLPVVYTSLTISLSLLELLIHKATYDELKAHQLSVIEVPNYHFSILNLKQLKRNWQEDIEYSKYIGDEFLSSNASLLMQVPSAIIPEESNILLNPKHKDFNKVKVLKAKSFRFDTRIFKN